MLQPSGHTSAFQQSGANGIPTNWIIVEHPIGPHPRHRFCRARLPYQAVQCLVHVRDRPPNHQLLRSIDAANGRYPLSHSWYSHFVRYIILWYWLYVLVANKRQWDGRIPWRMPLLGQRPTAHFTSITNHGRQFKSNFVPGRQLQSDFVPDWQLQSNFVPDRQLYFEL